MKHIFYLSGDFIDLGKEEVMSLFEIKDSKLLNTLLITNLDDDSKSLNNIFPHLALTKHIYRFLFECKVNDLIDSMKKYDWASVYKDDFCLRVTNLHDDTITKKSINEKNNKINFSEKNLAGYIWCSLSNPKVNLENPKTLIQLFITKDKAYCGLLIYENKEDFESRKAHLRPFHHPSSMHPKIARALVNISGVKDKEILLDPFCGTGGFLIESGLMGIRSIGYDISKIIINGCIENLKHFKIKKRNYKIRKQNAISMADKFDCAVTDLPYGLNSNAMMDYDKKDWKKHRLNLKIQKEGFYENLEKFYLSFLKNLRKNLKKKAVIVFPSYADYKRLLKQANFKIEKEFEQYIHRSLTRKIVKIS